MKRLIIAILLLCLFVSTNAPAQSTAVPQLINYQGRLTNASGNPLATADYTLSFSIYDGPNVGATLIWGPQVFDGATGTGHGAMVPVVKGFFNVILGPHDTSSRAVGAAFAAPNRFLEVTVKNGPPILPRQQMLSAPYALQALHTPGSVPVGSVIPFFGDLATLTDNWKLCDGAVVNDPDSPFNGQNVPNLLDRFIKGTANCIGCTGGSTFHSHSISSSNMTAWFPVQSGNSWHLAVQPVSRATEFYTDLWTLTHPKADGGTNYRSHGHINGTAWGSTDASSNIPRYVDLYFIIRIK
jgi:hypothetical protein